MNSLKRLAAVCALLPVLAGAGPAPKRPSPLDHIKSLCIPHRANPQSVRAAALAAGWGTMTEVGKPTVLEMDGSSGYDLYRQIGGVQMQLAVGTRAFEPVEEIETLFAGVSEDFCRIVTTPGSAADFAEVKAWVSDKSTDRGLSVMYGDPDRRQRLHISNKSVVAKALETDSLWWVRAEHSRGRLAVEYVAWYKGFASHQADGYQEL